MKSRNILYFIRFRARIKLAQLTRLYPQADDAEQSGDPRIRTLWRYSKALHDAMALKYGTSPWSLRQIVGVACGLDDLDTLPFIPKDTPPRK